MWKATRITADAAEKMQINAGLLLNKFDVSTPVEPKDEDIVCETTGDFSITCTPTTEDMFADVNNAPVNTMEGKRIIGWVCGLAVTALSVTEETLKLSIGAADTADNGGIHPRDTYELSDFKSLYWIGDMVDENKLFVVVMDNTVSTGGVSITTTNNGKGKLGLTLTPHTSLADQTKVPMAFYILEKSDSSAQAASVEPDEE